MNEINQLEELIKEPKSNKRVSIIKTIAVKERSILYGARQINSAYLAAELARELFRYADKEMIIVCSLDSKCKPLSLEIVSIGTVNSCIASPRDIFKYSILSNAVNIIVFHNHPSGDCTPSNEDILITKRLVESGNLLGITVLDHIIIGEDNYISLNEKGVIGKDVNQIYIK